MSTKTYRTLCDVTEVNPHLHKVTSRPPLHEAAVQHQGSGVWRVTLTTVPFARSFTDASLSRALTRAGELVSKAAGADLMRFSGRQRTAMGQQECPKPMGMGVICAQPAGVGTVWCEWHPGGKERSDG